MKNEKLFKRMNIQFFAEPGTDGGSEPGVGGGGAGNTETVSKADYDKLLKQFEAQKNRIDELARNEKEYKKQIADKQTDEEKKAQAEKETQDLIAQYKSQIENMSIEKELLSGGFTSEETNKIIESKGDSLKLAKSLSEIFKKKLEDSKKAWEKELVDKTKSVSGSGGSNSNQVDPTVEAYLGGKTNVTNTARDYYLNKK